MNESQMLRDDLNYDLGESLSKSAKVIAARRVARARPHLALQYVEAQQTNDLTPYDVDDDPKLLVGWPEAGAAAAAASTMELGEPQGEAEFMEWVRGLALDFKHVVENTTVWRLLWEGDLTRHRNEDIVQCVAGLMWTVQCKAADIDISKETNMGRGPVDFKFSAGWKKRALIEVKLISSTGFFRGASKQLPQYLTTEQIEGGLYVCVGFRDADFAEDRLKRVRDTCKALGEAKGVKIEPIFVDARPSTKKSASTLTEKDGGTSIGAVCGLFRAEVGAATRRNGG